VPEGDAVYLTARRLDRALAGQTLTRSQFRWPSLATVDLAGATVQRTGTHGKHLLTRLERDGVPLTLHTHLKMEGRWRVVDLGRRWPAPTHEVRVVLSTERKEAIGFSLGIVELLPTADEDQVVGHLGPDLLGKTWDGEAAARRLVAAPDRLLGEVLLDQTVVAGMGTIYVAESCFVHGASPLAPVGTVRDPERLLTRGRMMLQTGVRTGRPVTTGDRRDPLWIYGRHRQPCRRCGPIVQAGPIGPPDKQRTTYWCPRCQPL
jgi:endonuclease-8